MAPEHSRDQSLSQSTRLYKIKQTSCVNNYQQLCRYINLRCLRHTFARYRRGIRQLHVVLYLNKSTQYDTENKEEEIKCWHPAINSSVLVCCVPVWGKYFEKSDEYLLISDLSPTA